MITLTFTDNGLDLNLAQAPNVMGLQLQKWMTQVIAHLHQAVARNMDGGLIGRRTGNLMRSLTERVTISGNGIVGELFPDPDKAIYGAIQEEGGTVVPKNASMLTIPLDAMLTSNGVARGTARDVRDNPIAYGFGSTFVAKGIIFGRELGKFTRGQYQQSAIPLFALKPSVTIPGRHYLQTTLIQEWSWIADALEKVTQETVDVLFGEGALPA